MTPQIITLQEVKACALAFYHAKKLIAQSRVKRLTYQFRTYRCAMSAAFTTETMSELAKRGLTDGAVTEGIVVIHDKDEFTQIQTIQRAHDEWQLVRNDKARRKALERHFLTLLET